MREEEEVWSGERYNGGSGGRREADRQTP